MFQKSSWWLFLLIFGLTLGGIQSLGVWVRPGAASAAVTPSQVDPSTTDAARRHVQCQPTHWRSMLMQR
ncbi:MAG: hypothetical protein HYX68_06275 [Planctomycetes bacterium]|nr:hypothetical protein [Planctomycetota bacterium]